MKNICSVITLLLLLAAPAMAGDSTQQTLTINGEQVAKAVASITFDGDDVVLHFTDGTDQSVEMDAVRLTIATTIDAIGEIKSPVSSDRLSIEGLAAGTTVSVYDASGHAVLTTTAGETNAQLQLQSLRRGVYVMKAGSQIVKFQKR